MASLFTKRIAAYLADFFVVSAFMWIVSFVLYLLANPYSMNSLYSYLQVRSNNGEYVSWQQAIVRNLTKIYWFPIIFDWAIGKILGKNDRILNSITKTRVFDELR